MALAALTACGSGPKGDPVVKEVRAGVEAQLGIAPELVRCAGNRCEVELAGAQLAVSLSGDRDVVWQSDEVLLAAPLVALVSGELADLGVTAAVDCGPPVQPVPADGRVTCRIEGGGLAWVGLGGAGAGEGTAAGGAGTIDVEVALTPEAIAARTAASDDEALERMSRALDRGEEDGDEDHDDDDDDEGDAGLDAGIDAPARPGPGG